MTATLAPPAVNGLPAAVPSVPVMRFSVAQYHQMQQTGILWSGAPVELLEGWLALKKSMNPPHVYTAARLQELLAHIVPPGWFVNAQDPITTLESEPEPDATVVRGERRDYLKAHPTPKDVGMIGEVGDSTLAYDRGIKKRIFARASIPVYWIIDLEQRCVEVYTDPTGPADEPEYRQHKVYGEQEWVPVILDGKEVGKLEVKALLP